MFAIFGKHVRNLPRVYRNAEVSSCNFTSTSALSYELPAAMNFINGQRAIPKCQEVFKVREPGTGDVLGSVQSSGEDDVNEAVWSACDRFEKWSSLAWSERATVLHEAATIVRKRQKELAELDCMDTGRPISEIQYDITAGADALDYYASLGTTTIDQYVKLPDGAFAYITKEPYGVVGAVGSWNFPFLGAVWKVAPGLISGNTMVFKPSPLAPVVTPVLAEIMFEAGAPAGTLNVLQGHATTGSLMCKHPNISKVSFTGGVETGKKILENSASGIKQVTLELGGKSPLIIFPDCDLENTVNATLNANFELGGESCTNGTRVFIHASMRDAFVEKIVDRVKNIKVGNPMDPSVQVGALITEDHLNKVLGYVESAKQEGAQVECGGECLKMADPKIASGYYMSPCVLTNCNDNMRAVKEEIFGPVMSILTFETEEEVLSRANDTQYGLASGVFTRDLARAHRCASKLNAGTCWVNSYNIFLPPLPSGGFKMSGIGRENGHEALSAYTQTKVVYVNNNKVETSF